MAHALDFDDVHEFAVMHPGIAVIPVCMAMAERKGRLSGKAFLTATALGVDMMCRLAMATTPGESPIKTGWHLTSLYGYLGAAATAGRIMGLDLDQMVHAMGIAYHQCSGNGQAVKDGALTKRLGPGFSVRGGIVSALMAGKGVTGARNILEGESGLYRIYFQGRYDPKTLTAELGQRFEGLNVAFKPYPCCRGIHPAIDAALEIVQEQGLSPDRIQHIALAVSEDHDFLLCTPKEAKANPRNPVDAQFSIPWGVACAIARRKVGLAEFYPETIKDPLILSLTAKTTVTADNSLRRAGGVDPTRVTLTTVQGQVYSRYVEAPLGSIERPMSYADCARKFKDCAGQLPVANCDALIDLIARLDTLDDIGSLIQQLCP
jgi:2-methylcitrate dehydratase PrpD